MGKAKLLDTEESFELVRRYNIPIPPYHVINPYVDIEDYRSKFSYPLVVKVLSSNIIHKTEAGAVKIGIKNFDELIDVISELKHKFNGIVESFLIQKMVKPGIEVSIGGLKDRVFGPVVMFGSGGILIELFEDVSFRIAPISMYDALEMMEETRVSRLLNGFRGFPIIDKKRVARLVVNVSKLVWENKNISELDINPIIINDRFEYAVDVRIFKEEEEVNE